MLCDRNATYNSLSNEQKKEHNRIARKAFARGIKDPKLKDRLLTRGANSLEDAIAYAIEAGSDALTTVPKSELFCRTCRTNGHRELECTRKNNDGNIVNSLVSALRTFSIDANKRLAPNNAIRGRGFSGRSPLVQNNNYRYPYNRGYDNRYNNGINRGQYNPNGTMGDNSSPWSWNPSGSNRQGNLSINNGNRPTYSGNGHGNNGNSYNNNNGNKNNNQQYNTNKNGQQNGKPQFKRPNQGNFNVMFAPEESSDSFHLSSSSSDESEN